MNIRTINCILTVIVVVGVTSYGAMNCPDGSDFGMRTLPNFIWSPSNPLERGSAGLLSYSGTVQVYLNSRPYMQYKFAAKHSYNGLMPNVEYADWLELANFRIEDGETNDHTVDGETQVIVPYDDWSGTIKLLYGIKSTDCGTETDTRTKRYYN